LYHHGAIGLAHKNMSYLLHIKQLSQVRPVVYARSHGLIRPIGTLGKPNKRDRAEALAHHELIVQGMKTKV